MLQNSKDLPVLTEIDSALSHAAVVARYNTIARSNMDRLGFKDRDGLEIVIRDFSGRTPLEEYLSGLMEKKYVVPKDRWSLTEGTTKQGDHDEIVHFSRIATLHPDMVDAVASYAAQAHELLVTDRERAIRHGENLDIFLSNINGFYPAIGREIAISHFLRKPDVDLSMAFMLADRLLERQQVYEEAIKRNLASSLASTIMSTYVDQKFIQNSYGDDYRNRIMLKMPNPYRQKDEDSSEYRPSDKSLFKTLRRESINFLQDLSVDTKNESLNTLE